MGSTNSLPLDIDNCQLTKLNFDCLERVFAYLSTKDLIHLSQINPIIYDAILERAISKRHIDFYELTQIWTLEKIFAKFGKHMTEVAINENHFELWKKIRTAPINNFLRLLIKYCTANQITEMNLTFDYRKVDAKLLNAAKPFFTNIQTLSVTGTSSNSGDRNFLTTTIINAAKNLSMLTLENVTINFNALNFECMKNLETLSISETNCVNTTNNWQRLLSSQPKLKSFAWDNYSNPNYTICKYIADHCADTLEKFMDKQLNVPEQFQSETFIMNRYDYFSNFKRLKKVAITGYLDSGCDLINVLAIIAQKNTVQKLWIQFLDGSEIVEDTFVVPLVGNFDNCSSLTTLSIGNLGNDYFWCDIIVRFIKCAENLHTITISGKYISETQIASIASAARRLKILDLSTHIFQKQIVAVNPPICSLLADISAKWKRRNKKAAVPAILNVRVSSKQKNQLDKYGFDLNNDRIQIVEVFQPLILFQIERSMRWETAYECDIPQKNLIDRRETKI